MALSSILKDIEKYHDNIECLVNILQKTPIHIRLKATARAITLLKTKNNGNDDYKISWFNNCIRPSLAISEKVNYSEFEPKEIEIIKEICEFNNPYQLNDNEAFAYLKLLKHGNMLDLDLSL